MHTLQKHERIEPNWSFMFFDWMTDSLKDIYITNFDKLYNHTNETFLHGLITELGYFGVPIDYKRAMDYYIEGARLNNHYSLLKLFYVYKDHYSKFNIEQNIDTAMFFLIKAACYNEPYLDLNRIEPLNILNIIIDKKDENLSKCKELLIRFKECKQFRGEFDLTQQELNFMLQYLILSFASGAFTFKKALDGFEQIVENDKYPEACFKLACIYYSPVNTELCPRNVNKSIEIFNFLVSLGYSKAYSPFYRVLEEQNDLERAEKILFLSKEAKNFSLNFYANFLAQNKDDIIIKSSKIFKHFFRSFLYGNLISVVICFEIITQITIKTRNNITFDNKYYLRLIFDFVKKARQMDNFYQILDYDVVILFFQIYAFYYYKGILVTRDYYKAIEILTEPFQHQKSIKNYRKIFYYLSKVYKKLGSTELYESYYKKSFDMYIILKEFPYHHYVIGKALFRGSKYISKSIKDAYFFFNLGATYKDNQYFINSLYSVKCADFIQKHRDSFKLISPNIVDHFKYISEDEICQICYCNIRQVIYKTCGHNYICLICFEKMRTKDGLYKCPMCKQDSNEIVNTFSTY
jgi:TPR repeat protein